nr:hypothetical protein [Methanocaldococcus jannaschii]
MLKKLFGKDDEKTDERIKKLENRIEKIELELKTIKNTSSYPQIIRIEKELQQIIKTDIDKLTTLYIKLQPKPNTIEQTKNHTNTKTRTTPTIIKNSRKTKTKHKIKRNNLPSPKTTTKREKNNKSHSQRKW